MTKPSLQKSGQRLLLIAETLDVGGTERSIVNILPGLIQRGYECEVACLRSPYTFASEIEKLGVPVHRMELSFFWNVPEGVFKLSRILWKGHFDVLFSYIFFPANYLALSKFLSPKGIRIVCLGCLEFERDVFKSAWMRFRKWFRITLLKYLIDGRLAVSSPIASHYEQFLHSGDIAVIPNSVSHFALNFMPKDSKESTRKKYSVSMEDLVLVTPARFIREKGHTYLIHAIKILASRGITLKALLFGYGKLEEALRAQIQSEGLEESVLLLPALSQSDLFEAITASDLFVLPSVSEGFGLAIAEAAALHAPIVSTKVGGILDVVEDGISALLVPSEDPLSLADAIERLSKDEVLREKLSTNARKRAEEKFNSDAVSEQLHQYFLSLQSKKKHGEKKSNLLLNENHV